jgi:hypothetical protein
MATQRYTVEECAMALATSRTLQHCVAANQVATGGVRWLQGPCMAGNAEGALRAQSQNVANDLKCY